MEQIATIGLDLAKNVFQVHCVDGVGNWSAPHFAGHISY